MKSFLRENPTIAFGLGLPLLLVVVFLLMSGIPKLLVLPPGQNTTGETLTPSGEAPKATRIGVPDLEGVTIDSSSIAPDGYEFSIGRDGYSGDVFGGLFNSSRYQHEAVLTKNGRRIHLPNAVGPYYSSNTHFIGYYSAEHFANSLGLSVTLILMGVAFLGVGTIAIKVKQRI